MSTSARTMLLRLEAVRAEFGGEAGSRKLELLRGLRKRRLRFADEVLRLHECLAFLHAYPDSREVLHEVEAMLAAFGERSDLRRGREALADTGILGTPIHYRFFWPTARWLRRRCPESLTIEWREFEAKDRLVEFLPVLLPYCETLALDSWSFTPKEWLERLKGTSETDAAFLVHRFEKMKADAVAKERLFESLDVPMRISPGPRTPTRTGAKIPDTPVTYQTGPLDRRRPDLREAVKEEPASVRALSPAEGRRMVDLAVTAMITRSRDLDAFAYGDPRDVRVVDFGDGLQFVCIGQIPERRLMLESVYGFLTIKSGVPIGYVLASSLFRSTEIAYNVFETYRGAEAARTFGRVLAMAHRLFGARSFSIDPYQLGHDNQEGLQSGAWWFYHKLGFRPRDPEIRRLVREEKRRMRADPGHRTGVGTLQELSARHMYLSLAEEEEAETVADLPIGDLGLALSKMLADRFGADREKALRTLSVEAAERLGVDSPADLPPGERLAWGRWAPLVLMLPGLARWKPEQRRDLARVMRAKGGRRESEFVRLFDAHPRLGPALKKLAYG